MIHTHAAKPHVKASLDTFPYPCVLVLNGTLGHNSALDLYLTSHLSLDVESNEARDYPVKFWYRPESPSLIKGVVCLKKRMPPVLALEYAYMLILLSWPIDTLIVFETGVFFPNKTSLKMAQRACRDGMSLMTLEPFQVSEFSSMGSTLSYYTNRFVTWFLKRPLQVSQSIWGRIGGQGLPLMILKRRFATRTLMRSLALLFHPCESKGSMTAIVPLHLVAKSGLSVQLAPKSLAYISVQANDHHLTQMILDRQDWFVDWMWPFTNIYRLCLGLVRRFKGCANRCQRNDESDDDDTIETQKLTSHHDVWYKSSARACMTLVECGLSLVELFLPSICVLFWIDMMPFLTPVATWAEDALLISHAFLLRTTFVSWSDVRPWQQAWIHWIIMIYFWLLDTSTIVATALVWITQGMETQYKCLAYSLLLRGVLTLADSIRLDSKALLSWKTWATASFTMPWVIRTSPIYSMLHIPRRTIPYAHKNRKMYSLQESLLRKKSLEWYATFRTWIVITWSVLNAVLLSVQRFLKNYGDFTSRYPARVLAYCVACLHIWAVLWILYDWFRTPPKQERAITIEPRPSQRVDPRPTSAVNPVEHKVARMLRKPYE